ncbi:hypothetical protein HD806DRAFT_540079 [Xylariaceae sp. AK1471]|nr:hypothetical protein HD806DRAFT_540079 [Xylariaceae sp. AK1471]
MAITSLPPLYDYNFITVTIAYHAGDSILSTIPPRKKRKTEENPEDEVDYIQDPAIPTADGDILVDEKSQFDNDNQPMFSRDLQFSLARDK